MISQEIPKRAFFEAGRWLERSLGRDDGDWLEDGENLWEVKANLRE